MARLHDELDSMGSDFELETICLIATSENFDVSTDGKGRKVWNLMGLRIGWLPLRNSGIRLQPYETSRSYS